MADVPDARSATAFIFPMCILGSEGIVAACSTAASDLMQRHHTRSEGSIEINTPAWLFFECYFFVGMTLLNWSGMTDSTYTRSRHLGSLGDFLNAECQTHGIVYPCVYYTVTRGGPYFKGLRDLLGELGVQVWLELVSRCSVRVCGALDVSVRMFAGTYVEAQESQYLLWQRWVPKAPAVAYSELRFPQPWDWYQFPVWQSMGQQPVTEYIAERVYDEDRIAMELAMTESTTET